MPGHVFVITVTDLFRQVCALCLCNKINSIVFAMFKICIIKVLIGIFAMPVGSYMRLAGPEPLS